jgi:hypothetical protein
MLSFRSMRTPSTVGAVDSEGRAPLLLNRKQPFKTIVNGS